MFGKLRKLFAPKPRYVFEDGSYLFGSDINLQYVEGEKCVRLAIELAKGRAVIFTPDALKVWDKPYDGGVISDQKREAITKKVRFYFQKKAYDCLID